MRLLAIALLVAGTAACGQSSNPSPTNPSPTPTGSSSVSIVSGASTKGSSAYNPNPITITHGQSVMWVNNDTTTHTSTSDNNTFNSGSIAPGGSFSFMVPNAGTFTYHCTIHPGMVGTVTVQ